MKNDSDVMDNIPSRPVGERFNFGDVVLEVVAAHLWVEYAKRQFQEEIDKFNG